MLPVTAMSQSSLADKIKKYPGEKLVWHEEFNGNSLDTACWTNEMRVHVNHEAQRYTNGENLTISGGIATLTAKKVTDGQAFGAYTSARIKTQGKKSFLYGRVEARAKLPSGLGTWPAIWMLGEDKAHVGWPACGEIDIMEHVGFDPAVIHASMHTTSSHGATVNTGTTKLPTYDTGYHVYGANWTPEKIEFYIDSPSNVFYTYNPSVKDAATWPYDKPFYIILNLAIGGDWGGKEGIDDSIFPCSMQVDYVRVYQKK